MIAERRSRTAEIATRTLADVLESGSIEEQRVVRSAYVDRVVPRRGTDTLAQRALLLLRGDDAAFEPLPGRGRRVELRSWPAWDRHDGTPAGATE